PDRYLQRCHLFLDPEWLKIPTLSQALNQPAESHIQVVKEPCIWLDRRINQPIANQMISGRSIAVAVSLRSMQAVAPGTNLLKGGPEQRSILSSIDTERGRVGCLKTTNVKLSSAPRKQPLLR